MKSCEPESEERTPPDLCAGPSSPVVVPTPGAARGAMPPAPGARVSPSSRLGLCMEEAAGHGFLGSPSLGRVVGAG